MGQVFTQSTDVVRKELERKANGATFKRKTFSTITKLRSDYSHAEMFNERRTQAMTNLFKLMAKHFMFKYPPSFEPSTTYGDLLLWVKRHLEKFKEKKDKLSNANWDHCFWDGENIVLVEFISNTSLFFPMEVVTYDYGNDDYNRALRYIIGDLIQNYKIETIFNSEFSGYIEMLLDDDLDREQREDIEKYENPGEYIGKVDDKFHYWKMTESCIAEFNTGSDKVILDLLENENVYNDKIKQKAYELFEQYLHLREYRFDLRELMVSSPFVGIMGEWPLLPEQYCMVVPNTTDYIFDSYESWINEIAGNGDVLPFAVHRIYTMDGVETNLPLKKGFELFDDLNTKFLDLQWSHSNSDQ